MTDWNDTETINILEFAKRSERKANGDARHKPRLIKSSKEFVAGYVAPQYIIEGIIRQQYIYSLTGKTGDGKTALQLYFAYLLATGRLLGRREVEKCRILYLAGENPDDVMARWIAMSDVLGFDADTIDVHFVEGASVSKMFDSVKAEVQDIGGFGAVVVDTAAAYFEGDAENDNVQAGNYAGQLRKFSELAGNPGVIVGCHPIKSGEVLLPRGGGAFLNEMDGNLTAKKVSDEVVELHWCGKYRGANFEPVLFKLVPIRSERVKDAKGRLIPTIMAQLTDGKTLDVLADEVASDQEQVLLLHDYTPGITVREVADKLGWKSEHGHNTAKVSRILGELKVHGLMTKDLRGRHSLTKKGKEEAKRLQNRA
jgi:hypothetical protein